MACWRLGPSQVRDFAHLPRSRQRLLLRAAALLWAARIGLWILPFDRLRRVMGRWDQGSPSRPSAARSSARQISDAVRAAAPYVPAATCLTQALAAESLLRSEGYLAALRIGVARSSSGMLRAHAWVEWNGQNLLDHLDPVERYTPLPPLTRPAAGR